MRMRHISGDGSGFPSEYHSPNSPVASYALANRGLTGVFALPAVFTIDLWGRRNLLLFTFPFLCICLLWTGFSFWFKNLKTEVAMVTTGMYLFEIFYSPGEGPVPFTYSAEAFPIRVRDVGMSWATATTYATSPTFPNPPILRSYSANCSPTLTDGASTLSSPSPGRACSRPSSPKAPSAGTRPGV